jgi:hypothetical protein
VLFQSLNQGQFRIQVLTGQISRAVFLAAAAANAGVQIDQIFPGEVFDVFYSEGLGFFDVRNDRSEAPFGSQSRTK